MSGTGEWTPDEPLDTETYDSWDEELDEQDVVTPGATADPEGERSLDRQLVLDEAEAEEAGIELDDPERLAVLDGGIDDPDGAGLPGRRRRPQGDGWDLDAEERLTGEQLAADEDDDDVDEE
jgi:hypothetical protein